MKRAFPILGAVLLLVGSGVALGVPSAPTSALDALSRTKPKPTKPTKRSKVPTTLVEVDIALKELDAERAALEAESSDIDATLGVIEARVLARGRTYYKQTRAGLLPAGGGFEELVDHAARVEKNRVSLTRDIEDARDLRRRRDDISERLSELAGERAPLDAQKSAFASAASLVRQADDRKAAFDRAFETSVSPSDAVIYGAEQGPTDGDAGAGFASLVGHLPFPIAGRAEVRKIEGPAGPGTILELHAPGGATARSVAAGRVVFADRYEDNHVTVILDHGRRYFTLYGNLGAVQVKVGESVPSGAAIGNIATKNGKSVLTFELRKSGRAIEAAPWFGL